MDASALGSVLGFWNQTDAVGKATAALLLLMSVATWYLLLVKAWQLVRVRREAPRLLHAFWQAPDLEQAAQRVQEAAASNPFSRLVTELVAGLRARDSADAALGASLGMDDYAASILRATLQRVRRGLDSGLGVLASIGATAPFVGLFGTVWGIYHALVAIGFSGDASLDKVAGPVGEALIMTALGIAVAVPAVLAYNFLLRANRDIARALDGFAQDLHACVAEPRARVADERTVLAGAAAAARKRGGA